MTPAWNIPADIPEVQVYEYRVFRPGPGPLPKPSYIHGTCQCGSGSNVRGPGHSSWCPQVLP